jgi:hypothetical protein
MSFITDDKELMTILMGAGASHLMKFGQTMARQSTSDEDPKIQQARTAFLPYRIAIPMLVNLQRQIDPANALPKGVPLGTKLDENADLSAKVKDFRTLGDFIQWAADKQLTWEGKRFAWNKNEETDARQAGAWTFTSYPRDRSTRDLVTREPIPVIAYALKPELVDYLTYLRRFAVQENNKVLQVMIGKIIGEANTYLAAAGEKTIETKEKPAAPKPDLDLDGVVDGFTSDTLDMDTWDAGLNAYPSFTSGNITKKLTIKDISDQGSFFQWLRFMKVKNKNGIVAASGTRGDPCLAVHILYKRAQYLSSVAAAGDKVKANYSKMVAQYLKAVTEYGKNLQMDGKPCAVVSPGTTATTTQPGKEIGTGAGDANEKQIAALLIDIMQPQYMPLQVGIIDFNRINMFVDKMQKLIGAAASDEAKNRNAEIQRNINALTGTIIPNTQNLSNHNQFKIGGEGGTSDISSLLHLLNPGKEKEIIALLVSLERVVTFVRQIILAFQSAYGETISSVYPNAKNMLYQQTESVFRSNVQDIYNLRSVATRNVPRK